MHDILAQEHSIFPLPNFGALSSLHGSNAYLDVVPTPEGYNHIALFNPADSAKPQFLTGGEWEVTGGVRGVDAKKGLVYVSEYALQCADSELRIRYFIAAKPSVERHLFSAPIPISSSEKSVEPRALTDTTKPGYYQAKFSPEAGFYVLSYLGPNIPWTKVVSVDSCK